MSDLEGLEIFSSKQLLDELIRREIKAEKSKREIIDYSIFPIFNGESPCRNCRHDSIGEDWLSTVIIDFQPWDIIKRTCNKCNSSWEERRINNK